MLPSIFAYVGLICRSSTILFLSTGYASSDAYSQDNTQRIDGHQAPPGLHLDGVASLERLWKNRPLDGIPVAMALEIVNLRTTKDMTKELTCCAPQGIIH